MLEDLDHALARGALIYAEILGVGSSCDAYHITQPDPEGIAIAYRFALRDAGIAPDQIDFISAHGTGTRANDRAEVSALREVFGENLKNIPINSIKSMIGHTMGAASALEAVMTVLAIQKSKIPPTMNLVELDPELGIIDVVPNQFREKKVNIAFETAAGFGGNNSVIIFGRFE
jgi:3-oxoacyl-[acyl-carrier-protein] synthase II